MSFFLFALFGDEPEVFLPKISQTAILHAAHFLRVVKLDTEVYIYTQMEGIDAAQYTKVPNQQISLFWPVSFGKRLEGAILYELFLLINIEKYN